MHIILTHEQADFDAIASILGAYLLSPSAVPVMPRRLNRNVRQFLTHYRNDLPFLEASALPQEKIESITLVDTQSLVTLKGMNKDTTVHVIDHHAIRANLASEWTVSTHNLGACTTLFVENLHANHIHLGITQATLLLMGIYEDTGSLSYVRTTSRDILAAAYLIEHGASLSIASQYMNPPLSDEQNQLYDQLITKAENIVMAGKKIIIACASALEMEDEVSSVTHKLRDFLDPAALFMLVNTSEGVRVVARSTTDQINVAALLNNFGGGGHERAASALIQIENRKIDPDGSETLKKIHDELIRILPRFILPDITVGQIMSPDPLTLSPETKTHEAALLMRKYGYEGYPVIENQMVVGLLTRRAVDRAVAHKLNLPVRSLMEAGKVTVHPDDSLDDLQRVMTSSDWGQIPVVDPDTGKVIGIVTRTDLIKTLGSTFLHSLAQENLAGELEKALPPARLFLLQAIAEIAHQRKNAAYIVGGFVRDLILGRPSQDFDVVIEGNAIDLAFSLCKKYGGRVTSHKRFGTAKWRIYEIRDKLIANLANADQNPGELPESLDLISARTEFYDYPSALPTVEDSSIKLDLHRRDFSINTMAMRLDGQHYGNLYDYWGGFEDLQNGLVRVLHSLSFVDDPTRMLRAVRFEQRFNFKIESRTQQLMEEARLLLRQLSPDRLRHEIDLIFLETHPSAIFLRLQKLGLLNAINPNLVFPDVVAVNLEKWLSTVPEPFWGFLTAPNANGLRRDLGYLIWFYYLDEQYALDVCHQLRLPAHLLGTLKDLQRIKSLSFPLECSQPSQIVEMLEGLSLLALFIASLLDFPEKTKTLIIHYMREWKHIKSTVDGFILQQRGIKPGPIYRSILKSLKYAWLDGIVTSHSEEMELLGKLIDSMSEMKSS